MPAPARATAGAWGPAAGCPAGRVPPGRLRALRPQPDLESLSQAAWLWVGRAAWGCQSVTQSQTLRVSESPRLRPWRPGAALRIQARPRRHAVSRPGARAAHRSGA